MDEREGLLGLAPRRKAAGFTQAGLAVALNVSRSLLAAWETGQVWPSAGRLPKMAQLLGCTIAELYEPPAKPIITQEGGTEPCSRTAEISTGTPGALPV